jgi:flagellar biosynthetic protein FliR
LRALIDMEWILRLLLISVRLSALLWATPLFALARIPQHVKLVVVLAFSAGIAVVAQPGVTVSMSIPALVLAVLGELLVGALMAFGLHCAFGAFQFGGRLLDLQMGFGVATLINPSSEEQDPLLGTALLLAGLMTFYLVDGHLWLVRSFVASYEWFPMGALPEELHLDVVVAQFGLMFTMGTVLVAPIVAALLLIDIGLAMAAKTMPQLNVFMLSIPVKIAVGLALFAALVPYIGWLVGQVPESVFDYWRAVAR